MEIALVIKRRHDGRIEISGAITDKVVAYGLLEAAKDAVREYIARNESRIVQPPNGGAGIGLAEGASP